jgi:hypothetical protein
VELDHWIRHRSASIDIHVHKAIHQHPVMFDRWLLYHTFVSSIAFSNKHLSEKETPRMKLSSFAARALTWVACAALLFISSVSAKAILGVDLGSLYMKVALVQRGAPLEIVTNMHSKRMTEQMILFDQGTRFYGADASSLLARKSTSTPVAMSIMLGRDEDHPAVKVRDKIT